MTVSGTYDCQFVLVTNEIAVLNAIPDVDRAPVEAQRQERLQALQQVEQHHREEREGQQRGRVAGPALLGVRVDPDHPVDRPLDPPVPPVGVHGGQVVAERHVHRGEEQQEDAELNEPGHRGVTSELLRPDEGDEQVDDQAECGQPADHVLKNHDPSSLALVGAVIRNAVLIGDLASSVTAAPTPAASAPAARSRRRSPARRPRRPSQGPPPSRPLRPGGHQDATAVHRRGGILTAS